jgi:long-chain fatty acid transport protein
MNTLTRRTLLVSALACGAAPLPAIQADGSGLYEIATPDVGLASAGYGARAQDASTLFKNPAGTSLLEGSQFQGGLQLTYGSENSWFSFCDLHMTWKS